MLARSVTKMNSETWKSADVGSAEGDCFCENFNEFNNYLDVFVACGCEISCIPRCVVVFLSTLNNVKLKMMV